MDELNNIQNPNVPSGLPSQGMSGQIPPMPQMSQASMKKKNSLFLIVIFALVAVGTFAWWYIGQMSEEPIIIDQPKINRDVREDLELSKEIEEVDTSDLDAEFKAIDADLNSL